MKRASHSSYNEEERQASFTSTHRHTSPSHLTSEMVRDFFRRPRLTDIHYRKPPPEMYHRSKRPPMPFSPQHIEGAAFEDFWLNSVANHFNFACYCHFDHTSSVFCVEDDILSRFIYHNSSVYVWDLENRYVYFTSLLEGLPIDLKRYIFIIWRDVIEKAGQKDYDHLSFFGHDHYHNIFKKRKLR